MHIKPLILIVTLAFLTSALPVESIPSLTLHQPIVILSDTDFVPENGVIAGSGSVDDPFVISGYRIVSLGEETGAAVFLKNTRAHVLIQNLRIHPLLPNDSSPGFGILIEDAANVTIISNEISLAWNGIGVFRSENVNIETNHVEAPPTSLVIASSYFGIYSVESNSISISNNRVSGVGISIAVSHSNEFVITGNDVTDTPIGRSVSIVGSSNGIVEANTVRGGSNVGIGISDSTQIKIRNNLLLDGGGFYAERGSNITIWKNQVNNARRGVDFHDVAGLELECNSFVKAQSAGWILPGNFSISHNRWSESGPLRIYPGVDIHNNSFIDTPVERFSNSGSVDATKNWWGRATGPTAGQAGPGLSYQPWLTSEPEGC